MKSIIVTIVFVLSGVLFSEQVFTQSNMEKWKTESYCLATGEKGTTFIEIHPVTRRYKLLPERAKKMAVYAVLFNGVSANWHIPCDTIYPILNDKAVIKAQKKFFKDFFKDYGGYSKYVALADTQGKYELVKKRGEGWRMGYQVSVYTEMLEADLRVAGILKN